MGLVNRLFFYINMAQKQVDMNIKTVEDGKKRKICYKLDKSYNISVFKNDTEETVINNRKARDRYLYQKKCG